jgi:hypothetical protein
LIQRFGQWVSLPRVQLRLWGTWTCIWLVLMPVTLVTVLKASLEWVVFMSLFANAASCGTAWVAALSYHRARRVDEANLHAKLDALGDHHGVPDWPTSKGS